MRIGIRAVAVAGALLVLGAALTTAGGTGAGAMPSAPAADTAAPRTSVLVPKAEARLTGTAILSAVASNDVGVTRVEYRLGGNGVYYDVLIGVATPYSCCGWVLRWDTRTVPDGRYVIASRAFDAAGHVTRSALVAVHVDNVYGPSVVALPTTDLRDRSPVRLIGDGFAPNDQVIVAPLAHNLFDYGVTEFPTDHTGGFDASYSVRQLVALNNGAQLVDCARAGDCALFVGQLLIEQGVTVPIRFHDATPLAATIVAPGPSTTLSGQAILSAAAHDDGRVTHVEYVLYDKQSAGTGNSPRIVSLGKATPYSCCGWVLRFDTTRFPSGPNYKVVARVTDDQGNVAFSPPLAITIAN